MLEKICATANALFQQTQQDVEKPERIQRTKSYTRIRDELISDLIVLSGYIIAFDVLKETE